LTVRYTQQHQKNNLKNSLTSGGVVYSTNYELRGSRGMKKLGVIGGLGPLATSRLYELIIKMTDVTRDQDHMEILIHSKPSIPDRTDYILGRSKENPLNMMSEVGENLVLAGADYLAIPCITGHYFYENLSKRIHVPIIHMIKETVNHCKRLGVSCAGIMATKGTIFSKLFQLEFQHEGIKTVVPSEIMQDYVTSLIYQNIKVNIPPDMDKFTAVEKELRENGAEIIILGCTELSLIKRDYLIGPGYLDVLEVLAMQSILLCEANLKDEYRAFIDTQPIILR